MDSEAIASEAAVANSPQQPVVVYCAYGFHVGCNTAIKLRDAVQTITLFALRAVGVLDARARGLVVQAVMPALPAKRELSALAG